VVKPVRKDPIDNKTEAANQLRLLGAVQVMWGGEMIAKPGPRKMLALLGYLALQDNAVARDALVGLFWGELPESKARNNLRVTLSRLTKKMPGVVQAERDYIYFLHAGDAGVVWVDALEFERLCSQASTSPQEQARAAALYRGRFMDGLYLDDCPAFDSWLVAEQSRRHLQIVRVLRQLARHQTHMGEYEQGLDYASRLLSLEPWDEAAHRQMMELLAYSGQRGAALAQYETCRRVLEDELGVEPEGETTALFEQLKATAREQPDEVTHNLPPQVTPFFGRKQELTDLVRRLRNPDYRLITLVGEGGVGKTRLSVAAAEQAAARFPDGTWFVSLAGVEADPEEGEEQLATHNKIATAIAEVLEFSLRGRDAPREQMLAHLLGKEILLLLDNFEQLIPSADFVAEILQRTPGVTLLVTSRQRLNLQAEYALRVGGLPVPASPQSSHEVGERRGVSGDAADAAGEYPSLQLFAERADRTLAGFALQEGNLPAVVQVCQLVEGMPLGIELAATWVETLSLGEITQNIQENLDFLTTQMRDVPDRHRSIRAVFLGSWGLLNPVEQLALASLSVFRGGFTSEAAMSVISDQLEMASDAPIEYPLNMDYCSLITEKLVAKSLLRMTETGRYEFHELLRQFAAEKLGQNPENDTLVRARHSKFYTDFMFQRRESLKGFDQAVAMQEIQSEMANVSVSWAWSAAQGRIDQIERALDSLFVFYKIKSRFQEGGAAFESALTHLKKSTAWEDKHPNLID